MFSAGLPSSVISITFVLQTLRHYNQSVIADDFDEKGDTLGHIAARSGNVELFKVHKIVVGLGGQN